MLIFSDWKINHHAIFYCHAIVFLTTNTLFATTTAAQALSSTRILLNHEIAKHSHPKLYSQPTDPININVFGNCGCVRVHFMPKRITLHFRISNAIKCIWNHSNSFASHTRACTFFLCVFPVPILLLPRSRSLVISFYFYLTISFVWLFANARKQIMRSNWMRTFDKAENTIKLLEQYFWAYSHGKMGFTSKFTLI